MKKLAILSVLVCLFAVPGFCQDDYLDDVGGLSYGGGFGGPVVKITRLNDEAAIFVGGRGAMIVNGNWAIGGGGYGLVTDVVERRNGQKRYLSMGYGGLTFEHTRYLDDQLSLSIGTLIGGGGVGVNSDRFGSSDSGFFVMEPEIGIYSDVNNWLRIGGSVGYRWVLGSDVDGVSDGDLSGIAGSFHILFGTY